MSSKGVGKLGDTKGRELELDCARYSKGSGIGGACGGVDAFSAGNVDDGGMTRERESGPGW